MKHILLATMIVAVFGLPGCTRKVDTPVTPVVVASAPVVVVPVAKPLPEQGIDVVLRSHPHSIQVCYDSEFNGFFIQYAPYVDGRDDDGVRHGWFLLQKVDFYKAANNTWFTTEENEANLSIVFPDVTGLPCKQQTK